MQCSFDPKPRWERRKDARPQELLAAALDLFVERGFASTRLEDVARRAGVSKGTLYLYFANKEELFKAVVRDAIVPIIGEAEELIARFDGPSDELMRKVIMAWWQRSGECKTSGIPKLIMSEAGNFPDVAATTQVLIAPMLMLMTWKHSVGPCDSADLDPQAFLATFLDMALHGLCAVPVAPTTSAL